QRLRPPSVLHEGGQSDEGHARRGRADPSAGLDDEQFRLLLGRARRRICAGRAAGRDGARRAHRAGGRHQVRLLPVHVDIRNSRPRRSRGNRAGGPAAARAANDIGPLQGRGPDESAQGRSQCDAARDYRESDRVDQQRLQRGGSAGRAGARGRVRGSRSPGVPRGHRHDRVGPLSLRGPRSPAQIAGTCRARSARRDCQQQVNRFGSLPGAGAPEHRATLRRHRPRARGRPRGERIPVEDLRRSGAAGSGQVGRRDNTGRRHRIPRMRFACRGVILTVFLTLPAPAAAQSAASSVAIDYERAHESRKLVPPRLTSPIALDGRLDEPAWASAALAKGFLQNDPREGAPATFDTEVRVLYDADAIYLGLFARDDSPGKIIVSELKKDFDTGRSDAFIFIIDSFRDLRNGYMFAINPGGAKWDGQMSNEGRETNASWDGIWDVAARIGDDGWYAEVRVPFRTMKFKPEDTQTWGINFQRRNRRLNENSFWSPIPRIQSLSRVSLAGTVENLQQVRPGRSFRLKPWALASATSIPGKTTGDGDAGLDLKLGVTNGLTFDATVNTDFSQVEADEQQINLTRFSLFFPEKREFFLENSGVFQFGAGALNMGGGGGGGRQNPSQDMTLFFSRQIGLSAAGDALPILAGLRLTGRAGPFSVGVMNVEQRRHDGVAATNFTALRLRRDILRASDIGVMVLNKDGATTNRVVGADANFRFFTDLRFNAAVAKTMSPGSVTPGTGRDWYSRTTASYRSSFWDLRAFYQAIGERFNDEMGFVPRRGVNNGL